MSGLVATVKQWLEGERTTAGSTDINSHHIIESLLSEIQRIEALNITLAEELQRLQTKGADDLRREVAEECAVICETAEYVVRSYGCAREIRLKFGLPTHRT